MLSIQNSRLHFQMKNNGGAGSKDAPHLGYHLVWYCPVCKWPYKVQSSGDPVIHLEGQCTQGMTMCSNLRNDREWSNSFGLLLLLFLASGFPACVES